ncbi:Uncharacterised protein [Leclercia adecarboxylata]|uniref:Uncharacterized protein n=1 Tax=Leclercia adecarboxylata TaxID=83655 RepID=A0A4U9HMA3_9ENTR|nr:Uncharacterised protein [Leclercia adecarboxylata]
MLAARFDKGLVGALDDALAADVDPAARGHLAIHCQPLRIQLVEVFPGRPVRHQVGVGDQHARSVFVGFEYADRFAGLHQQGFVVFQFGEGGNYRVITGPVTRRAANPAIHHQLVRIFRHVGIEVVH